MKVYVGQTRGRSLIARLSALGWGEMTVREEFPPRRHPWALDNGAFRDWKSSIPFDERAFVDSLEQAATHPVPPDWVVAPDIVGGGRASLDVSTQWVASLKARGFRVALAAQDGMDVDALRDAVSRNGFDCIFVGGSLPWKLASGVALVELARSLGVPCHVGRVGTFPRVNWARRIRADSIDSCLPLWSERNLRAFAEAVAGRQMECFT